MKYSPAMTARMRIIAADPEAILTKLTEKGITLLHVEKMNALTVIINVKSSDYKEVVFLLKKWNTEYILLDKHEYVTFGSAVLPRILLLFAVVFLLFATVYLQGKILIIKVVGNDTVPTRRIVEQANASGVFFGANAVEIRSEKVKNAMLEAIHELQWVGVNTSGCVATVYVEEKSSIDLHPNNSVGVSSIVASTDGVIESCTVISGTMQCEVGQAVREGDLLISGYTDCGILIQATQAKGEVYARTLRQNQVIMPTCRNKKDTAIQKTVNYSLRIGKKLINFDNNSGIYHNSCAKIYEEQYMMLPGGFFLPVSLIKETIVVYDVNEAAACAQNTEALLNNCSESYLHTLMVAGSIKDKAVHLQESEDCIILSGQYICSEMIGRHKEEDILQGE